MNPNPENRKSFITQLPGFALIVSAMIAVMAIVVISYNLSSQDSSPTDAAINSIRGLKPVELSGDLTPPDAILNRIMASNINRDAFSTPFYDGGANEVSLNSFKGSGLIVNFWATWCVPCVKEMPALDRLAAKISASNVKVLALSVDRKALEKVPVFYKEIGIKNLGVMFDEKGVLSKLMGVKGLPTTVLIRADGTVFGSVVGMAEWDNDEVAQYLGRVLSTISTSK